jgi:hypothetical protein
MFLSRGASAGCYPGIGLHRVDSCWINRLRPDWRSEHHSDAPEMIGPSSATRQLHEASPTGTLFPIFPSS